VIGLHLGCRLLLLLKALQSYGRTQRSISGIQMVMEILLSAEAQNLFLGATER
jgi:hypothetical protein